MSNRFLIMAAACLLTLGMAGCSSDVEEPIPPPIRPV